MKLLIIGFLIFAFASGSIWPQFMHDPQHSGRTDIVVQQDLGVVWTYYPPQNTPAWMWSQPVLDGNGNIYYPAGNYFISVDPSGNERWNRYTNHTFAGPGAVFGDTVYFACSEGALFAYTTSGNFLWQFPMIHPMNGGPIVDQNGIIYIGDDVTVQDTAYVYAINPDGSQRWATPVDSSNGIYTTPALDPDGDKIYLPTGDWYLHAFSTTDGGVIWNYPLQSNFNINYSSPSVMEYNASKYIFCGDLGSFSGYATWYAIDESGNLHWDFLTDNSIQHTAAFDTDGCVYLGSNDGILRKVSVNGDSIWARSFSGYISNPTIDGAGNVLIGCEDNHLYVLNGTDGSILQNITLSGDVSCPILGSEGEVYVIVGLGNLVCLRNTSGVRNAKDEASWQLEIYPNPSRTDFSITIDNNQGPLKACIYNITGIKVFEKDFMRSMVWKPVSNPAGVYFIKIRGNGQVVAEAKLILLAQ